MYLCRKLIDASYKDIGRSFGKRDHSTVINACEKVESMMQKSDAYAQAIRELESKIH
jgi:chromosomal replication initiator protein